MHEAVIYRTIFRSYMIGRFNQLVEKRIDSQRNDIKKDIDNRVKLEKDKESEVE